MCSTGGVSRNNRAKKQAMANSHGAAKFASGTTLVVLVIASLAFLIFAMVDLTQNTLVFGTGSYYIALMAILGGLVVIFWFFVIWDYATIPSKGISEKARFWWPRFGWDFWAFFAACIMGVGTIIGLLAAFMIKYGSGAIADLGALDPLDELSDRFIFNTEFIVIANFAIMVTGIDLLFSYVLREKFYYLRPLSELGADTGSVSDLSSKGF